MKLKILDKVYDILTFGIALRAENLIDFRIFLNPHQLLFNDEIFNSDKSLHSLLAEQTNYFSDNNIARISTDNFSFLIENDNFNALVNSIGDCTIPYCEVYSDNSNRRIKLSKVRYIANVKYKEDRDLSLYLLASETCMEDFK